MTEDNTLSDSEIRKIHKLEYLTTIEEKGSLVKKIGFSRGNFVILEISGTRAIHTEISIGDSFYETISSQADRGEYDTAKEFAKRFLEPIQKFEY